LNPKTFTLEREKGERGEEEGAFPGLEMVRSKMIDFDFTSTGN